MGKKITKFPGQAPANKGFRPVKRKPMNAMENMNINNGIVIELINEYKEKKDGDSLNNLINELVQHAFFIPAVVREDKTPAPKLMKSKEGDVYLGIITDKEQLPEDQREGVLLMLPYLVINRMAINPVDNIKGIAINPFSENFIIQRPLLERIEEVEKNKKEANEAKQKEINALTSIGKVVTDENGNKSVQMNEQQYNQFERTQFEVGYIPTKLFTEGQAFIDKLLEERETYVDEMYEDSYREKRMYPYLPEDFAVMPMTLSEDLTVIRIDMPEKDILFGNAFRVYISWDSSKSEARYFRITKGKENKKVLLEEVDKDKKVKIIGDAPVEGTELSTITDLIGYVDPE